MSRVKRGREGRKKNNKSSRRSAPPDVFGVAEACDCPSCSGADFDPEEMLDELTASAAELAECEDPLDAEIVGAAFLSIGAIAGEAFEEALVGGFIPGFEARATPGALAMLLAIGSVDQGRAGKAASAAADRLVEAGLPRPGWAEELGEPVTVADCGRLSDQHGIASMLTCSFHRAGRSHAVAISVDHLDCGAADEIMLFGADHLPYTREVMRATGRDDGLEIATEPVDAAEFRWRVETALDARAVHDADDLRDPETDDEPTEDPTDDGPGYPALAVLMRARMSALPVPGRPAAPHGEEGGGDAGLTAAQVLAQLTRRGGIPFGAGLPAKPRGRTSVTALPAKRKRSGRPAPVYQIKVGLRGAKPPIWRRLQVPADINLARLHTVIQVAFDWADSHLHVFETPYGDFGSAGAELDHRPEGPVTLEQVAPGVKSKIRYTYDFGDDWEHDILVEKVLDHDEAVHYPRCIDGRRSAPPDDCGGIWGYAELVEILADSDHPEHEDKLDWLGLDDAADFDPIDFAAIEVNQALSDLFGK